MHPREVAIVGALLLFLLVPWLTLRDVWRHPSTRWAAAGRSRVTTTVLVLLVPVLGPAWYLRRIRPAVRGPQAIARGRS